MKKKKVLPGFLPDSLVPHLNWIWLIPALGFWTWQQVVHTRLGTPFSFLIFGKGILLLVEAAFLYSITQQKGFYFLGMFPLSWLALSRFQWDISAADENRPWIWLSLFLLMEIVILCFPDGKKLLGLLVPLWTALIWFYKDSFLLPLAFLTAPGKRFKNAAWARWGGLVAGLALFAAFRGWSLKIDEFDLETVMVQNRFFVFLILSWLGLAAYDSKWKGTYRHALIPFFLLPLGFLFWGRGDFALFLEVGTFQWVLVWMTGFGLEAFRKYMMDPSWHGRLVWFALGLALSGGVL